MAAGLVRDGGEGQLSDATPSTVRGRVDVAGRRSLAVLVACVRATAAVAVVRSTPSVLG